MVRFIIVLATAAACSRAATAPSPAIDASVPLVASDSGDARAHTSALDALPHPPARTASAIKIVGYPKSVSSGMNDPADRVGFTSDGAEYGYCATLGARDPPSTTCFTRLADGTSKQRSTDDAKGDYSPTLARNLATWMKSSGLAKLDASRPADEQFAKPISGSWTFSDVTLWVNPVSGDGATTNAFVQVGGAVDGEAPVYPVTLKAEQGRTTVFYHSSWANDVSISKDGTELGVVGLFFCMEWCDAFTVYRNSTAAFASLVYNDTGFRHYKKGELAMAATLFLEATFADPKAKLPPYNLACVWARLGDARAKDALVVAIERDPSVKTRAPKDADFASVKDTPWFHALTD